MVTLNKCDMKTEKNINIKKDNLLQFAVILLIIVAVNIISSFLFHRFDLTAEKRFTLSKSTKNMLHHLDDVVYVKVYLDEGIREEGEVRELDAFERFMEVAAISDGEMLNYSNIASDCGVSAKTVKSYFQILYDTLIGYEIPAFRKEIKRKIVQAPRFYYFDVGLANYLMGRHSLKRGTDDYGHAFEHYVMQEIIAYKGYNDKRDVISYWHTYDKKEVDVIIGDAKVAIEIKSTEHVETKHKKGLKAFEEEHPECRLILVSLDTITRKSGNVELIYVLDFLRMLWNCEIF